MQAFVVLKTAVTGEYAVEITSTNGEIIHRERFNDDVHRIGLSPLQKGVYLITIRSEDFAATRKIIKQRNDPLF